MSRASFRTFRLTVLDNPPPYEPTTCESCGAVIVLSDGGYSVGADGYMCGACSAKKYKDLLC